MLDYWTGAKLQMDSVIISAKQEKIHSKSMFVHATEKNEITDVKRKLKTNAINFDRHV